MEIITNEEAKVLKRRIQQRKYREKNRLKNAIKWKKRYENNREHECKVRCERQKKKKLIEKYMWEQQTPQEQRANMLRYVKDFLEGRIKD